MVLLIIYVLFSFIIEAFMSNFFVSTFSDMSYFTTLYTVISLVIIYPYFYNHKKYYVLFSFFPLFLIVNTMFIYFVFCLFLLLVTGWGRSTPPDL